MGFDNEAHFSNDGLVRIIHEKTRLCILTSLMTHPNGSAFGNLKRLFKFTGGNQSRQIKALQNADLECVTKKYEDNRPYTGFAITPKRQKQFLEYVNALERSSRMPSTYKKYQ